MRALLNVDVARHLGVVLLKPGSELMRLFGKGRVLVEMPPAEMDSLPSGRLPDARQPLRDDTELRPFFQNERVLKAAGGTNAMEEWLERSVKHCQWPHSIYHHPELVNFRHEPGVIRTCWHCDNELRNQAVQSLDKLVVSNVTDWIIDTALGYREQQIPAGECGYRCRSHLRAELQPVKHRYRMDVVNEGLESDGRYDRSILG